MPLVSPVPLPNELHPSIKARRNTDRNCNPDYWESMYEWYRYLRNATVDELFERHEQIANNFRVLGTTERLAWQHDSVFSAWYWLRKEHQLRFEMQLRHLQPRIQLAISTEDVLRPMTNGGAAYGEVLFRFSRRDWLERTLSEGHLWLSAASALRNTNLGSARSDDELKKARILPGEHSTITNEQGDSVRPVGDINEWVEAQEYYLLSTAADYHPFMYDAFRGSDACLVIHDAHELSNRLALAVSRQHPSCDFGEMLVHYYDPRELAGINESLDPIRSKRFEYAFEMEWRFACVPRGVQNADHIELVVGSLEDIATIVPKGCQLVRKPPPA